MLPRLGLCALALGFSTTANAQVNPAYEVATWSKFKTAAITYTFDDNTAKQLPVALPLFDRYNFKITLFTVTNWNPNWAGLRTASTNGHEVTSHTLSHPSLPTLTVAQQVTELQQSQAIIKTNVPTARCETIAYPNCNIGDIPSIQSYYIAGRTCSGQIMTSTPPDFYNLSSIITGTTGTVQTAATFNARVESAKASRGWCVFLTHGIDDDGGYSPTQSTELSAHLAYMNTNIADYWVGTFSDVAKYIKERNALSLTETTISADLLSLTATDNLANNVYDVPVTVRRLLPATWANAAVARAGVTVPSTISTVNGVKYIVFDVVPDQGEIRLAKATVTSNLGASQAIATETWPNPFTDRTTVEAKGNFSYSVYSLEGKLVETGQGTNSVKFGNNLASGTYVVKISQNGKVVSSKVIKK
ncbi:hypothetical protein GCM10011383_08590 [Hymenobacter cavernae]|uniref:T9SS C-terminal target domain-containing protein n=1 Tax=Hymenobacter cavernae TaxID=2044852 RepID=A0ABQ1TNM6_9BACT|nr:hypothetical protein GCM10011383_08590 [Hymenobacter cavernae]